MGPQTASDIFENSGIVVKIYGYGNTHNILDKGYGDTHNIFT
jgi:hypothetical protein